MEVELAEVRDFLATHAPFDELPQDLLDALPRRLSVRYVRRGTRILSVGDPNDVMYVLRSGAVDIADGEGNLVERSDPGTSFAMSTLLTGEPSRYDFTAIEDSLLLVVPGAVFDELRRNDAGFAEFYSQAHVSRLRRAVGSLQVSGRGEAVLKTVTSDLVRRPPVTTTGDTTIRDAAALMAREAVSCLPVMADGRLVGILTDRDLRTRVLAVDRDPNDPVSSVMTLEPATARATALAFEVLMEMVGSNIHHIPVLDGDGRLVGLVTSSDLLRLQHDNPVHLVAEITAAPDVATLAGVSTRIARVLEQLVAEDATANDMGRVVTALGDAIERRLLTLAEQELGSPPAPYCWVVLGSQARKEQGLASDQDNALILDPSADADSDGWYAALAARVTDGLAACGYRRCPGGVMATNPRWRVPVDTWRSYFTDWARTPEPDAVLNAGIFYDMRPLHGDAALVGGLREEVLAETREAGLLLAYLAKQAVAQRPPIGFFRGFVLEKEGEHRDRLDLKQGGVASVVQIARVHALAAGLPALNTQVRLAEAARAGGLSTGLAAELHDAYEFLSYLRLRHQGRAVRAGREPDNFVDPQLLSGFERRHLRDAFRVVTVAQQGLAQRMPLGQLP
ncbi:MAG TPA: DUF294 nucleotidyltransferase-like domain-containing protein [Egicoccus sp.]|nr:DUF294 nucleotidyltransferase-like domain-containing protein [Egicoccus sp.]HSK23339.1 DUF294 nucleotidyltransferase-like domain-containing protein [Egicoccus sp.]